MSESVVLPALGESVTEGTVTRWLKKVGDTVAVDEPLVEVSTDKVDTEIPSPIAGVIEQILVQEDETVQVGAVLAIVGSGSGAAAPAAAPVAAPVVEAPAPVAAPVAPPAPVAAPVVAAPVAPVVAAPVQTSTPAGTVDAGYVTPLVRKLAQEAGIDLTQVLGTGVGGRIRKDDVLAANSAPAQTFASAPAAAKPAAAPFVPGAASPLRGTTEPMSRLRKVLAERAVASMVSTAQLTTVVEVDVTKIAQLRQRVQQQFVAKTGGKLNFMPFFALAAAEALRVHPKLNATIDGENIVYHGTENISFAVDTEKGLLTPVIRDASTLNIAQIAQQIADLAARTRANQLKPDELGGGTFTLTNTGSRGALFDTPVVFLPQVAILGTGIVSKRPVVVTDADGQESIAIRSMVYLALSYDHRLVDGADASRFLVDVKSRLEDANFDSVLGL
ncbi:2-oxoglutarate dehydrogenase, E2 component, dihydrolipoamide succinyltransferase [Rhodoluna sp.]|uniref:2-oxoglutarate dehydrogenase, E2 component, dihydrolipoamide succinyltransferase n=1 Tax=Rhodoluna sp. TaxID=1969481 RepID=UPI0025CBA4D6|nr:2-oxoglutarate dehydrogenase, E2 component, dihydrolipoamide succinyltransferase [Rhodoluna sp.]